MKVLTKMLEKVKDNKSCKFDFYVIKQGNYRIRWFRNGNKTKIYYHENCVCIVDDYAKTISLSDCGYKHSRSTKRILNFLESYFYNYTRICVGSLNLDE